MKRVVGIGTVLLAFSAFISLGMPDGLHGVAWPSVRESFGLPIDAIGLLLIAGTIGYMTSGFFSGYLMRKLGVGLLLALSVGATAISLLAYSFAPAWWIFIVMAVLSGLGAGAIDAGLNTYVAKHHSERLMQWLHASFGVGITAGPVIMTTVLSASGNWRPGYLIVAVLQIILATAFFITRKWWIKPDSSEDGSANPLVEIEAEASMLESLLHIPVLLSMLMFFVYTGVELGLGLWSYSLLTEARGIDTVVAGYITGGYWAMFTLGRILAGTISNKLPVRRLVIYSILCAVVGLVLLMLRINSLVTLLGIGVTGISIAPIFPGMVSSTGARVSKKHHNNTIGMQISAAGLGIAVLPGSAGLIARVLGLESIPVFMLVALLVLLGCFIAIKPRKPEKY